MPILAYRKTGKFGRKEISAGEFIAAVPTPSSTTVELILYEKEI